MKATLIIEKRGVSTHSRPKAAGTNEFYLEIYEKFQHTAARRRLASSLFKIMDTTRVSTHSRPKAAGCRKSSRDLLHSMVSTHSRPKAAGFSGHLSQTFMSCFNTQPPEGGWFVIWAVNISRAGFNTQPPEGGWKMSVKLAEDFNKFQHTAARRRLAQKPVTDDS